jgi:hypothetical protein
MSEQSFPFEGGTSVATAPAPLPPLQEPAGGQDRSKLLAVGGVATVLVLAVVGYFLFFAGGDEPAPVATPPKTVAPAAPAPADDTTTGSTGQQPRINQRNFGKDPFKALIDPEAEAAAAAAAAAGTTPTGTNGTPTTATGTTTAGTTPTTTTDSGVTEPAATTSHSFRVVAVAPNNSAIDVKVDGKVYNNLHAGEVFAKYFKVVLISGTTNAFQYGEEKFNVLGTKRLTIA